MLKFWFIASASQGTVYFVIQDVDERRSREYWVGMTFALGIHIAYKQASKAIRYELILIISSCLSVPLQIFGVEFHNETLTIFTSSIQNIASIEKDPQFASLSFAVVNSFFTVSALLVGPYAVIYFKPKLSLAASSCCYVVFLAAHAWEQPISLLASGALLGLGAGIRQLKVRTPLSKARRLTMPSRHVSYERCRKLRTPQGETPESALGTFNGIFFGVFHSCR